VRGSLSIFSCSTRFAGTKCPRGLRNFWLDTQIREESPFRKKWAAEAGFGFKLPEAVPRIKAGKGGRKPA
jgi:hypothetical protein